MEGEIGGEWGRIDRVLGAILAVLGADGGFWREVIFMDLQDEQDGVLGRDGGYMRGHGPIVMELGGLTVKW